MANVNTIAFGIYVWVGLSCTKRQVAFTIEKPQASELDLGRDSDREIPSLSLPKACDEKEHISPPVVEQEKNVFVKEDHLPRPQLAYV